MANYIFTNINAGIEIKAPTFSISNINDRLNGEADINVAISLGNPQADAVKFNVELGTYTYDGTQAILKDVEAWVVIELQKHVV